MVYRQNCVESGCAIAGFHCISIFCTVLSTSIPLATKTLARVTAQWKQYQLTQSAKERSRFVKLRVWGLNKPPWRQNARRWRKHCLNRSIYGFKSFSLGNDNWCAFEWKPLHEFGKPETLRCSLFVGGILVFRGDYASCPVTPVRLSIRLSHLISEIDHNLYKHTKWTTIWKTSTGGYIRCNYFIVPHHIIVFDVIWWLFSLKNGHIRHLNTTRDGRTNRRTGNCPQFRKQWNQP